MRAHLASHRRQRGTTAVEFAIVSVLFFTLLLGVMEMGRLLWTWNAAVEATRLGARLAVVCPKDVTEDHIVARMRAMLPALQPGHIEIDYLNPPNAPNSCTSATCKSVRVSLSGYTHAPIIPFLNLSLPIPAFQTTLPREYMDSAANPICQP